MNSLNNTSNKKHNSSRKLKPGDLVYIGGMPTVEEIKLGISEIWYILVHQECYFDIDGDFHLFGTFAISKEQKELCLVLKDRKTLCPNVQPSGHRWEHEIYQLLRADGSLCYLRDRPSDRFGDRR
jgi:hypothetical protein